MGEENETYKERIGWNGRKPESWDRPGGRGVSGLWSPYDPHDYVISNGLFYLAHMDPVPAQSIAWAAAVLFAFVTNKWWVFGSHTLEPRAVWGEFTSFVLCRIATFLFNLAAIFIMVDILKMEFFICKLAISVVVVVLNYVLSKLVIFTHKN